MSKDNDRAPVISLVQKVSKPASGVQETIDKLLNNLREMNATGKLTTFAVIGIIDKAVMTSMCTDDTSLTVIGAIDVGTNYLMDEIYDEIEEVSAPIK